MFYSKKMGQKYFHVVGVKCELWPAYRMASNNKLLLRLHTKVSIAVE